MTFQEIKELSGMGFSSEQIMELSRGNAPEKDPEKEPEKDTEKEPEKEPEKESDQEPEKNVDKLEEKVNGLSQKFDDLLKQMQKNNLKTASVDVLPDADIQSKAVDALSELISPKKKEESKK